MALLQRLQRFLTQPAADEATAALYAACVAQARQPAFYADMGVPDTVDGRFDMLLLHVVLVMRRLNAEADAKQRLFDLMFADMDRSLREMGVGDMSIGKKIKPMISAFYGRAQAYQHALLENDEELAAVLIRNIYGKVQPDARQVVKLASYVRRAVVLLDGQATDLIMSGQLEFPLPASI